MFIGIDLGTSSVKMILVDHDQNILATSNAALTVQNPKDGYSEQNPEEWINATLKCLEELKSRNPKEFSETNVSTMTDIFFNSLSVLHIL